jgi:NADH-quinone oxidoreductase subunit J
MTAMQLIFLTTAAVTIFAGVMMVSVRKLMHAALWLILVLFGVAVIFGLLESSFLVIIQIVVYIGAIAILIVFAIMLTHDAIDDTYKNSRRWIITAIVAVIALAGILLALFTWPQGQTLTTALTSGQQDIAAIGLAFLDPEGYLIPFEIASILLLAALIGGIYVGIEHKGEEN